MIGLEKNIQELWKDVTTFDDLQVKEFNTILDTLTKQLTDNMTKLLTNTNIWEVSDATGYIEQLFDKASDWALDLVTGTLHQYHILISDQHSRQLEWVLISIYTLIYHSISAIILTMCNKLATTYNIKVVPDEDVKAGALHVWLKANKQTLQASLLVFNSTVVAQVNYDSIWQILNSQSIRPILDSSYDQNPYSQTRVDWNGQNITFTKFTGLFQKLSNQIKEWN